MSADGISGTPATTAAARPRTPWSRKPLLVGAVALVVALAGAWWIAAPKRSVSTDNAYLQADSSVVAPKVRGLVAAVLVQHDQRVHRGDPLLRIDAEEFDARVASATANLQSARASVAAAKAALIALDAQERLAGSNMRAAQTSIRSSDAQQKQAEADRRRYDALIASGAVSRSAAEQFRTAAITAQANAEHSRAQFAVSRDAASVTHASRLALQAGLAQAEAGVATAKAALDLARQDQANTLIRAPIDGVVGDRQVEPGDYVQPGSRLLTVVPLDALYVIANFKETQTARMVVGQDASVEVDALPGQTLHGHVESFAPGSGSQFSLLPFEPGTGNFTKIVQRVPVRIRFDPGQAALARLRPGLSSTVSVKLGGSPSMQAAR
ncbi:HlyD family secretion protein [Rhodanobacter sp. FDAARGOS 1247]|uniref:HlyD family secretion protein n=1 Tax=Rhodanobacter sp. FDAARGOS 1247 TaxID=2778082 RepID=UPI00194F099B|nr:HlyD family secretion protein [Rhodanobacter sp. FDAARGOS 1247]QRP63101.1 HlyD family secretion protein [Rhodanobacter sp. FDAARGOS 1247]